MARPQFSEVIISVITFGILANAACTALCFLFRRSRRTGWYNSCRLSLALFLLLVVLWAYVNLTASLLDPATASSGSVCQVSVAFSVAIDQLAHVALEQFLLWVIHDDWKASDLAVLVPQAFLLVRLALGGAVVGTLRSQSDPICVPQPPTPPLAAALLIADIAIIIYLFARGIAVGLLHHVFRRRPGTARGRPVLLLLVALAAWTAASAPRILANPDMGLVIRSLVPDTALLLVISAVICFQNLLVLPQSKASFRRVDDDEADYPGPGRRGRVVVAADRGQPRDRNSIDSFYPPSLYGSIKGNMFRINNINIGQPQDYESTSLGFHRGIATRESAAVPPPFDLLPVLPAVKGRSWRWPNILDRFQRGPEQRSAGVRFKISHPIPQPTVERSDNAYAANAGAATLEPAIYENMVAVSAWNAVKQATSLPEPLHHPSDLEAGPERPVVGRQRQQTVLFLNSIVYDDPVAVRNILEAATHKTRQSIELSRWLDRTTSGHPSLLLSLPRATMLTGSAVMNLYRQYKRRPEADGWHSTKNSTILTRCAPGSPTQLPPLPPLPLVRPGRWGTGKPVQWLPNNTKSMTLDEKMDIFWLSFLPTGSSGIGQSRGSTKTVDRRPFLERRTGQGVGERVRIPSAFSRLNQSVVSSGNGRVGSDRDMALQATRSGMWMNVVDAPGEQAGVMGGGELVMVMLVPGVEPLSPSRSSRQRPWSKRDSRAQDNWHRRVGEACPSFSDRLEKQVMSAGPRKMVPPRPLRFSVSPPLKEPKPAVIESPHRAMAILKALVQRIDQAVLSQNYGPGLGEEQGGSVDVRMEEEDDSDNDERGEGRKDSDRQEAEEKSAQTAVLGRVTRATTIRLATPRQTWLSTGSRGEGEAGANTEANAPVAAAIDSAAAYDPFELKDLGQRDSEPASNDGNQQARSRDASEQLFSAAAALRKPWTTGLKPATSTADLARTVVTATTRTSGQAQRPPRQSRQVSRLPDILESPKPLPDRRDTLGIFRFPWGQRSDSAVVPMGAAGWDRDLDRDRLVAPVEYVSYFDDYDDDDEEEEEEEEEEGGDNSPAGEAGAVHSEDEASSLRKRTAGGAMGRDGAGLA